MAWDLILGAGASLLGGWLSGEGGRAASDATREAAAETVGLQREIYGDQRQHARPGYMTGGAATNKLAAMFGISPQDYEAAYGGSSGGGFGNPYSQSDQWSSYLNANADVYDYWKSNAKLREMYPNANDFAAYHYANFGQAEGRPLPTAGGDKSNQPVGGAQQVGQTPQGGSGNALNEFYDSPFYKLSTTINDEQFGQIKGQLGAAGKSISGPAENRYAKTLAGNTYGAFGDYTNALRSLAGMQQTAGSQISGAASQYGANAGNAIMAAGQARGNALQSAYQGWGQGIAGAIGEVGDYGKKNWGWT